MITKSGNFIPPNYRLIFTDKTFLTFPKETRNIDELFAVLIWHLERCEKNNFMRHEADFDKHMDTVVTSLEKIENYYKDL